MVKNLTNGKPLKLLFFFALPMVLGNLFQQLYNMVDSMVVGKFVGEDALAAVGSSFPVISLDCDCGRTFHGLYGCNFSAVRGRADKRDEDNHLYGADYTGGGRGDYYGAGRTFFISTA